jgi:uncharacterized protein (DUF433 family)
MATAIHGIVAGDESEIHDEPHIEGSRITVRSIHARVEERGLDPETVADRHDLDVASVYEALAYYHRNPREMREAEERHERAGEKAAELSDCTPPEQE